jgi:hypothetical protein
MATITRDLRLGLNAVALASAAGYVLDEWQRDVLLARPRRLLLNCSRQVGKSLVAALLAVHQSLYEPGSLAVVAGAGQRQALETIRACRSIYAALGRPVPAESENLLSLTLSTGSRILSIPSTEATVRGLAGVRLLVLDEASRIPDAFYGACLPFVATRDGALALLSTPAGRRGFFFEAYQHRERDGWFYTEIHAEQCPRIPASFLAEMRRTTSDAFYQQEFCGAFNDATAGAFRQADIAAAITTYPRWGLRRFTGATDATVTAADVQPPAAAAATTQDQDQDQDEDREYSTWNLARNRNGVTPARP